MYFKKYIYIIPYLGLGLCWLALLFPAAYFENVLYHHQIIKWIWGFYQDTLSLDVNIGFYSFPLQIYSSIIISSINVICLLTVLIIFYLNKNQVKDGTIKLFKYILPPIVVIISTIIWMLMMEVSEQLIYGISLWGRYIPCFGLIGIFLGAVLIIIGTILIKIMKNRSM